MISGKLIIAVSFNIKYAGSRIDDARSKFGSDAPAQPNYGRPRPAPSAGRPPAQFDLKPAPGRPAPGRAEPERENVPMKSVGGGKGMDMKCIISN